MNRFTNNVITTVALEACVLTSQAQTLVFKDDFSDPKLTGWTKLGDAWITNAVFSTNVNQQLVIRGSCGPWGTNDILGTHFPVGHTLSLSALGNDMTLEGRVDLVSASHVRI